MTTQLHDALMNIPIPEIVITDKQHEEYLQHCKSKELTFEYICPICGGWWVTAIDYQCEDYICPECAEDNWEAIDGEYDFYL